jgi:hypothetical protein
MTSAISLIIIYHTLHNCIRQKNWIACASWWIEFQLKYKNQGQKIPSQKKNCQEDRKLDGIE